MARRKAQWFKRGSWWRRIRLNRKYKDKLFRFLFRDKRDLLAGENKKLISLVEKKLKKGKTTEQIAAELEETADTIEEIIKNID